MKITLTSLHLATAQQVFDQVVEHLRAQGKKSAIIDSRNKQVCLYRSPEGLQCAAGCLIADDEYKEDFESKVWGNLTGEFGISNNHWLLITELQEIHDGSEVYTWERNFQGISRLHNLVYTPPQV